MFEPPTAESDTSVECADALTVSIAEERWVVANRFVVVARWADLHHPDRHAPRPLPATDQARAVVERRCRVQVGADGTPPVTDDSIVELAMLLQTTTHSAEALLRDVLELRHRLPRCWDAVLSGRLEGWKARQVAKVTRPLTLEQAHRVDALVIEALLGLPWGRALAVVEGKVIAVDPTGHEERRRAEEARHHVSTRRRSNAHGVRTLIARGAAGDIARLEAMIAHLADAMRRTGDPDPADTRRAKALAMLANPALACVFLTQTHDTSTAETTDVEPDTTDPTLFEEPAPEPSEPSPPSAVELAVAFGRILQSLGARAIERLRPRSVLYLHLAAEAVQGHPTTGVVRVEDPIAGGPIGLTQLRTWLATDRITLRPVIDPTGIEPVDGYEIPHQHREATHLLAPYEVFPYGTLPSRQTDTDHTEPYVRIDKGGPPGQTTITNLGPLSRRHHLAKTFGAFTVHRPTLGLHYWRTPTGHWYQVDHRGTHPHGTHRPAALDTAQRFDTTTMSTSEKHFRDQLIRHQAA
jgi:hypothetical protein